MTLDDWMARIKKNPDPQLEEMLKDWWAHNDEWYDKSRAKDKLIDLLEHKVIRQENQLKAMEEQRDYYKDILKYLLNDVSETSMLLKLSLEKFK